MLLVLQVQLLNRLVQQLLVVTTVVLSVMQTLLPQQQKQLTMLLAMPSTKLVLQVQLHQTLLLGLRNLTENEVVLQVKQLHTPPTLVSMLAMQLVMLKLQAVPLKLLAAILLNILKI